MQNILKNSYIDSKFIKSRLNRDNFWNLVFASLMSLGMMLGSKSIIFAYLTMIFVPLLIKHIQGVKFVKGHGFFNKDGLSLDEAKPKYTKSSIFGAWALAFLVSLTPTSSQILVFFIMFFIPTLYFIANNCPVSILFSRHSLPKPKFEPFDPNNMDSEPITHKSILYKSHFKLSDIRYRMAHSAQRRRN